MFITLGSCGQKVQLNKTPFSCDYNFLDGFNASLNSCFVSGVFEKETLNFAKGSGRIECEIATQCCRCGENVIINHIVDFNEEFHGDGDEDCYLLKGSLIELDQMIIDRILLSFPQKIICKNDCLGRCNKCGKNLNEGNCRCNKEIKLDDPANPFNKLRKLKF